MNPRLQQLLSYLPPQVRTFLAGNARQELTEGVNVHLLVHDNSCLVLESGKRVDIDGMDGQIDPSTLARGVQSLMPADRKDVSVMLLLPPSEFVATEINLPGVGKDNLSSALTLQTETFLPAYEGDLALALNTMGAESSAPHIALWMPESRLSDYFAAFEREGIFIAAILPRPLLATNPDGDRIVIDNDGQTCTALFSSNGVIRDWLHVHKTDFAQQEFVDDWQQVLASYGALPKTELNGIDDYTSIRTNFPASAYGFYPLGALAARKQVARGKRAVLAAAAAGVMLLIGAMPFIAQSLEFRKLANSLETNRQFSTEARQDQAIVVNFENEWGPINDFPEQNVREAMYTLQTLLLPDQLSSLEISEGLIRIQGTSAEPQAILQRLEQDPMFTEVIFSRATNNNRYYIDLRLSTVNFDAYMVRYFPDD